MYLQLSFDGQIVSTSGYPYKKVGDNVYLDSNGKILFEVNDYGNVEYYSSYDSDYERGKIKKIGGTYFYYNNYNSSSYEVGKIKSIGNTYFYYYGYNDTSYEQGKLHIIGQTYLYYYGYNDYSYEQGKLHKIGSTYIYYNSDGSIRSIG